MARKTREEWLEKAVEYLLPILAQAELKLGKYTVATGPCTGKHTLGECYNGSVACDNETRHIIIDFKIEDPFLVLATLLHEMIHAALPDHVHHGKDFKKAMFAVGLTGKPTATVAAEGTELHDRLMRMTTRLGKYPHVAVKPRRMRKRARPAYPKVRSQVVKDYWFSIRPELLQQHGVPEHMGKPMKVEA